MRAASASSSAGSSSGLAEDGELVAAEARDGVAGAGRGAQAARDARQQLVAGRVAERVVDELEAVEVEEEQADRAQRAAGGDVALHPLQRDVRPLEQQRAVRQAGQRVAHGERGQPALGVLALDRVAHGAQQHGAGRLALDEVVLRARPDGAQRQLVLARPLSTTTGSSGRAARSASRPARPKASGSERSSSTQSVGAVGDVRERLGERGDDGQGDPAGARPRPAPRARGARRRARPRRGGARAGRSSRLPIGQRHVERAAAAGGVVDPDRAAVALDDALAQREPDARSGCAPRGSGWRKIWKMRWRSASRHARRPGRRP